MAEDTRRSAVVIEDDSDIRTLVETVLRQAGFEVSSTASGTEGVELVRAHKPTIVTLDIGLIDIDGLEVARRIRLFTDCYIVMLTAQSDEADLLFGLESGADDYVIKPFRPRELRARIEAMLRRPRISNSFNTDAAEPPVTQARIPEIQAAPPPAAATEPENDELTYSHNGLTLNADTRTVELDAVELELTRTEFDLLQSILHSKRRVRSKADLVRELRDDEYIVNDFVSESEERSIEVHLANLRRKLSDDPKHPRWVETVRGVGYRLSPSRD